MKPTYFLGSPAHVSFGLTDMYIHWSKLHRTVCVHLYLVMFKVRYCEFAQVVKTKEDESVIIPIETVAERRMWTITKSDRKVQNLLLDRADIDKGEGRPLARTTIIEQIIQLRNDKYNELLGITSSTRLRKSIKRKVLQLPESVQLKLPTIDTITGIDCHVKLERPKVLSLTIEFNENVLEYLAQVAAWQRSNGVVSPRKVTIDSRPKVDSGHAKVSYVYSGKQQGKFRARSSKRSRYCSVVEDAISFVNRRPACDDSHTDDEDVTGSRADHLSDDERAGDGNDEVDGACEGKS